MKVGILVETEEGLDWPAWRTTYRAAERLGFESVWISDHLQSPWSTSRYGLDTWTALAVAAAETERVILGPLVSPVMFREPALVARMAANLHSLSGGRFVVGLGLGWNADEHAAAGIAFPPLASRRMRLIDTIERVRGASRAPILIGGKGRSLLPIVARYADQWNVTTSSAKLFSEASDRLDHECPEMVHRIVRSAAMGLLIGRNVDELRSRAERMRKCVPPLAEAEDVLHAAREMGWLVGDPRDVVAQLRSFAEVGVERVIFGHYDLSDVGLLELLAEVLP